MPLSPNFQFVAPTKEQMNLPDYAGSLARGLEAGFMPAVKSTDLLNKMMQAKYNQFKAGPEYQQAMLDFLRGQGANMWGRTANLPSERALHEAQAENLRTQAGMAKQKADIFKRFQERVSGGGSSGKQLNVSNESIDNEDYEPGMVLNAIYNRPSDEGGFKFVSSDMPKTVDEYSKDDVASGLRKYYSDSALAHAMGLQPPHSFVDPNTGMRYGELLDGSTVPISKEVSKITENEATEYGKNEAKAGKELTSQREQASKTLNDISLMENILKNPASEYAISSFGKGKYSIEMNPFIPKKIKDIRGQLLPITKDFLANSIAPLRGLGAMSNIEFDQFRGQAPSVDENRSIAVGKLKTLKVLTNQLVKRLEYTDKLIDDGFTKQEAQKMAAKKFEIKAPSASNSNQTITIRNNKTGVKETVTIEEARKRGVPNV